MPVNAQHIVRVGLVATTLTLTGTVANTPGVALADPDASGSSSSAAADPSSSPTDSASDSQPSTASSPGSAADTSVSSNVEKVPSSVNAQSDSQPSDDGPAVDPRDGIVQSSGGALTSSNTSTEPSAVDLSPVPETDKDETSASPADAPGGNAVRTHARTGHAQTAFATHRVDGRPP